MTSALTSSDNAPLEDAHQETSQQEQPTAAAPAPESPQNDANVPSLQHGQAAGTVPISIAVSQKALNQLEEHSHSSLDTELGGVLLGSVEYTDGGSALNIKAALPVKTDDHGPVHFTFSADSWALLHKDRSERYPDLDIVGWYHTHPGLGVFYSADDVIVHSAAFVMPWHVGLVIDPLYREGCWFGWSTPPQGDNLPQLNAINGFVELLEKGSESVLGWQLVSAKVWDSSYVPTPAAAVSDQVYVPANEWPSLPSISPWWGVLLGGTSLVLVVLLLLERLLDIFK